MRLVARWSTISSRINWWNDSNKR